MRVILSLTTTKVSMTVNDLTPAPNVYGAMANDHDDRGKESLHRGPISSQGPAMVWFSRTLWLECAVLLRAQKCAPPVGCNLCDVSDIVWYSRVCHAQSSRAACESDSFIFDNS
eukprot:jgi/Phyca11/14266/fgenesh1_pg.PHYCAscaffold_7_\